MGVERRTRLSQIQTQIQAAEEALQQAIDLINSFLEMFYLLYLYE